MEGKLLIQCKGAHAATFINENSLVGHCGDCAGAASGNPICAKSKTTLSPTIEAGKKLFIQNCTMSHFANQTRAKIGPGLKGLFKHKQLPYSHRPTKVSNVIEQIEKGNPKGKPMPMRPFGSKLSKAQINNVIAYLKTL